MLFYLMLTLNVKSCRVSGFGGMERWNGMVEWTTGMDYWNAPPTFVATPLPGDEAGKVTGVVVSGLVALYCICDSAELPQ